MQDWCKRVIDGQHGHLTKDLFSCLYIYVYPYLCNYEQATNVSHASEFYNLRKNQHEFSQIRNLSRIKLSVVDDIQGQTEGWLDVIGGGVGAVKYQFKKLLEDIQELLKPNVCCQHFLFFYAIISICFFFPLLACIISYNSCNLEAKESC